MNQDVNSANGQYVPNTGQEGMNLPANMPPQLQQQIQQWMQSYQSGNASQVPHDQVHGAFNQWAQQAPQQQVQQAMNQGYQQVPKQQLPGIAGTLLNFFGQHGLSPQQAGVSTTNPQQMSQQDVAKLHAYAAQQQPDALQQMFGKGGALSNPVVGMAVAGALAYGLHQMQQGGGFKL